MILVGRGLKYHLVPTPFKLYNYVGVPLTYVKAFSCRQIASILERNTEQLALFKFYTSQLQKSSKGGKNNKKFCLMPLGCMLRVFLYLVSHCEALYGLNKEQKILINYNAFHC